METKSVGVGELSKGSYVLIDGAPCKVTDLQVSKSGKHGHAKARITAVGVLDEKKRIIVAPSHDHIDVPIVDKRNASVLSVTGNSANVMDSETFETFDMAIPEELQGQITEGIQIVYWTVMGDKVMKQIKSKE
ncbi:MAG TPA: translation initiation factor IF-5A [Candidatus Nanoarchaeia archaeon]|nr:translation initiation factor IF-5A [Candidatus Nanoarchaeia archaeon]